METLPQESEAQRLGRLAGKCLQANTPNSWLVDPLPSNDYGYDYQVQVEAGGLVQDIFRLQLKGTTAPSLNAVGTEYSVLLALSTVHLYARATEPVLLVLCDLSVDLEHPKNCHLYFQWIHEDLRRINEKGVGDTQETVTFHVPVANRLNDASDLTTDIARFRKISKLGDQLDVVVKKDNPSLTPLERAELTSRLPRSLEQRGSALFHALTDDPTTSWVEAREGTLQWHLQAASTALSTGDVEEAQRALRSAEGLLAGAKHLEQADYWNLVGRVRAFTLDDAGAQAAFSEACRLSNDAPRYLAAWGECELRLRFRLGGSNDFTDALARLRGTDPFVAAMRARMIAAEGRYPDAIAIAESISGIEGIVAQAIIFSMQGSNDRAISACDAGLVIPALRSRTRQLFLVIRARARFSKAVGGISTDDPTTEIPLTGPAGASPELLRATWSDIALAITSLRAAGWPGNVELLADVWAATASMLGHQGATLPIMAEAGIARPSLPTLQIGIESLAAQVNNFTLALEANARQPDSDTRTLRRISMLHLAGHHKECTDLLVNRETSLAIETPALGFAMCLAISSAERIVRPDLVTRWESRLSSQSAFAPHLALLRFFRARTQNILAKDSAIAELDRQYQLLGRPQVIALQLFNELDPTDKQQAKRCVEIADDLQAVRLLNIDDSTHLAQALTTLGRWVDLLNLSNKGLERFEGSDRLTAIGALALDRLGRSADAHARLQLLIEKAEPDALALNTYIGIASRSGFTNEAVSCLERVLANERVHERQLLLLRHLFSLIHLSQSNDPRLVEIAWTIGQKANRNEEAEEGLFLMAMFSATLPADMPLEDSRRTEFQERIEAFVTRFPDSKIMRRARLPDSASPAELMRILQDISGTSEDQLRGREKLKNELHDGVAPIPYAWRPRNVLDSIPDLPTLWEISKRSRWEDAQLHLTMAMGDWKHVALERIQGQLPMLDLTALLVVADLNLFDELFRFFPKIAVGKATLLELQHLLSPMSGCPFRQKCVDLQNSLKTRFKSIEQPGIEQPEDDAFPVTRWALEEIVEAAKTNHYMIYSDDAFFRIYANAPAANPPSICTLDLLLALDDAGILSATAVATHIATLCSWRVGISIPTRYQIAILPNSLSAARSVGDGIEALRNDVLCSAIFNGLWDLRKPYGVIQGHAGTLLRDLASNPENTLQSIAALAGLWLGKAKFHRQAPTPVTRVIALLIGQAAFDERPMDKDTSHRLWEVLWALVEQEFGDRMNKDRYNDSIRIAGEVSAETDHRMSLNGDRSIRDRLLQGLTAGTSESDRFFVSYANALITLKKAP